MADESSSIALQLTVNLRGLAKINQLNAALRELKTSATSFQAGLSKGNTALKTTTDMAGKAAKNLTSLNKAARDAAKAANAPKGKAPNLMQEQFRAFSQQARAQEQAAARLAAAQRKQQADMVKGQNAANAALTRARQKMAADAIKSAQKTAAETAKANAKAAADSARAADKAQQQTLRAQAKAAANAMRARMAAIKQADAAEAAARKKQLAQFQAAEKAKTAAAAAEEKRRTTIATAAMNQRFAAVKAEQAREAAIMRKNQAEEERRAKLSQSLQGRISLVESSLDPIFRAGFRLQMVGRDIEAVGMKAINVMKGMADEFGKFEFMVNRASGALGINAREMDGNVNIADRFKVSIQNAARDLRLFDPTEVAKATYYWASTTGQQIDTLSQMQSVLKNVNPLMKIAAMTETDYETAIKGVYSILVQYGMKLGDTQMVTEKLHTITQLTAAEFPDLINSFKMVGPVAAANNVTFDDMAVLLGRLADAGIRCTMSGRALRQLFIQLNKPSEKAKEALDDLWDSTQAFAGQSYIDMVFPEGKFVGVNRYVDMLATATKNLTEHERNALLAQVTTANELPVLTALVQKATDAQNGLADATQKTGNLGAEAAARFRASWELLANSWNGVVGGFQRGVEILQIQIGERIARVFTPALEALTDGMSKISDWVTDPRNQQVIDFFVKLVGFTGGLLAVVGAITVFTGAMISLGAAIIFAVRAFGPLVSRFAGVVGVVGAVATALVRNFEYIRETAETVFQNLSDAITGSETDVESLGDAFSSFMNITGPIFDTLIHLIGDFTIMLSKMIKTVSESETGLAILKVAANALALILSAKLLKTILNLIPGFSKLGGAAKVAAVEVKAAGAAIAATSGRFAGMKAGLGSIAGMIGPGGAIALGLAGLVVAYEANLFGFKNFVDDLIRGLDRVVASTDDKIDAVIAKTAELRREAGRFAGDIDVAVRKDPRYSERESRVRDLEAQYSKFDTTDAFAFPEEATIRKQLQEARLEFEKFTTDTYQTVRDWVDELNDAGANITFDKYMEKMNEFTRKGFSFDEASENANRYFRGVMQSQKDAIAQARVLLDQLKNPVLPGDVGGRVPLSQNMMAAVKSELVTLRDKLPPEMQEEISSILEEGYLKGVVLDDDAMNNIGNDAEAAAAETAGEISSRLLEGSKKLMDFGKNLDSIMKEAFKPQRQVKSVFSEYLKGWISKGFRDTDGHFHIEAAYFAEEQMDELRLQWQTYADKLPPADAKKFVTDTIKQFKIDFKNGLPKAVTPDMATKLYQFMADVYEQANVPMPEGVKKMLHDRGATIPGYVADGVNGNKKPVKDAGSKLPTAAADGVKSTIEMAREAGISIAAAAAAGVDKNKPVMNPAGFRIGVAATQGIRSAKNQAIDAGKTLTGSAATGVTTDKGKVTTAGRTMGNLVATGVEGAKGVAKTAGQHVGGAVGTGINGLDAWTWGFHLGSQFSEGVASTAGKALAAAKRLSGIYADWLEHSTPKKGPLADDDMWGVHLVENISNGIYAGIPKAARASAQLAAAISEGYDFANENIAQGGVSIESNAQRVVKVEVSVTSPDGSVSRIQAAQFERAMMNNELINSIEHMSTVG